MISKVKRLGITVVLLLIASILLVDSLGTGDQESEVRLSWKEQLARVQAVMTEVEPDATLESLSASVHFDGENLLGRNQQNVPFSITLVTYRFDSSFPKKGYWLSYYDIEVGPHRPLTATTQFGPEEITLDHPMHIAELETALPIGPFEICQSTSVAAQQLMHTDLIHMKCTLWLDQITSVPDEFDLPANGISPGQAMKGRSDLRKCSSGFIQPRGSNLRFEQM